MRDFQRFLKGQVWHVEKGASLSGYGSENDKSRPFLIVSSDEGNATNDTIMMVPITSQPRPKMAVNVEFSQPGKGRSTIICSQVISVTPVQIEYYMGTVSPGIMHEVERAISAAMDMRSGKTNLKDIEALVDDLFKRHTEELEREKSIISVDQVLEGIKSRISELKFGVSDGTEDICEEPQDNVTQVEDKKRKAACIRNSEIKHGVGPAGKRSPGNAYWTDERMLEYLVDCDSLPIEEVIVKWGIGKKSTGFNYKTTFKKKLNIGGSKHKHKEVPPEPQDTYPQSSNDTNEGISFELERIIQ